MQDQKLDNSPINRIRKKSRERRDLTDDIAPTFQEFVTMRLNPTWRYIADRHWATYHDLCKPCSVRYDHIMKLETMEEELTPYIANLSKSQRDFDHLVSMASPKNKSPSKKDNSLHGRTVVKEFLDLSQEQRDGIYKIFKFDMGMFGYEFDAKTAEGKNEEECGDK